MNYLIAFLAGIIAAGRLKPAQATLKDHIDPNGEHNQACPKKTNSQPFRTLAELSTPKPITVQAETKERESGWKKLKTTAEVVGILAAIAAAFFAFRAMKANEHAAVAASAQATNSAKATALSRETLELQYGTRIRLAVGLYGLKPQPKIEAAVQFFGIGGPTGEGRPIERMRVLSKVEFRDSVPKRDEPITDQAYVPPYKEACRNPNAKEVVAAKQTCGYRMWNSPPMSDYDDYMAGKKKLYIWGRATYQDAVGPQEWAFCEYTTVNEVKAATETASASFSSFRPCDDRERYDE